MTQDEIIEMADIAEVDKGARIDELMAFANLVAAKERQRVLQLIKELRPAIKPLEGMGRGKTTDEWFDILVQAIEEKV